MSDSESESGSDASSSLAPEDTLVGGRAKRANAGNRLSHLLQHLDDEDVKADLLAEEEDDQKDYSASEAEDGDIAMESSDDSDDEGRPGADEDMAGERELKKQERVESKRKRKARELVRVQLPKKRVRISEPLPMGPAKQEPAQPKTPRTSSQSAYGPIRHSSRSQTVASAKSTEAKVKENKKRAIKTQEIMRLAAERRAAEAGPELTQADRMARALDIENDNKRSLNRWEKSEQERIRLQEEKLAAMRNRKLDGPVMRYWSGPVTWTWREGADGLPVYARFRYAKSGSSRASNVAKQSNDHEESEISAENGGPSREIDGPSRPLDGAVDITTTDANATDASAVAVDAAMIDDNTKQAEQTGLITDHAMSGSQDGQVEQSEIHESRRISTPEAQVTTMPGESSFLDGIDIYAADEPEPVEQPGELATATTDERPSTSANANAGSPAQTVELAIRESHPPADRATAEPADASTPAASTLPLRHESAARNLVMLDQFPSLPPSPPQSRRGSSSVPNPASTTVADAALAALLLPHATSAPPLTAEQTRYLTSKPRKNTALLRSALADSSLLPAPPQRAVCAISGKPARFRDPRTRLPYADMAASKAIQRVMANGCQYSALLSVWVGIVGEGTLGRVARGVPDGFWSGVVEKKEVIEL